MKKILILILCQISIMISCKKNNGCKDSNVFHSDIFIYGWDKSNEEIVKVELIEKGVSNLKAKKIELGNIINFYKFDKNASDELWLKIKENLKTDKEYILTLNDSLKYVINNFHTVNVERGTAITVKLLCEIQKFQVNENNVDFVGNHLRFNKNLGFRLKK